MKKYLYAHLLLRLASLVLLPALVVCDVLLTGTLCAGDACVDLWWAVQILLFYPTSQEPVRPSVPFIVASVLSALVVKIFHVPVMPAVSAGAALILGFAVRKSIVRFSEVNTLFHVSAVWRSVEDYMYLLNMAVCLWSGMMISVALAQNLAGWTGWAWAAVLAALYVAQYYRVYSRTTLFLSRSKEDLIRKAQRGSAYKQPVQYVDSDSRSAILFNEVVRIMETRKPWLQDDFSIDDLARLTHSNRLYLSKAVNFHSGRNFSQMVNFYRVRYAVELMRKDPKLKILEVSQMCGFHTVVSFNMAFKLNERMTPTEFLQSLKKLQ